MASMERVNKRAVGALVVAELISTLGSRMTYLALPWFVLVTTGSAAKMSVVLAVQILPMAILGVPSGSLVQRLGSRTAMLSADFARAPLIMALPLLHAAGYLSFGLLLAIVAASGAFMPPYAASQRVILPELVGEDVTLMSQSNSLIEGGTAAAALIGPALAGILIPLVGAPNVLYIDAATYLVAFVLVLLFVPRPKSLAEAAPPGGVLDTRSWAHSCSSSSSLGSSALPSLRPCPHMRISRSIALGSPGSSTAHWGRER